MDVLKPLGWKSLDRKRNYTRSMFKYKIIYDHAAPSLRHYFRLYSEGDTIHDLRNHATDLVLPKPKREWCADTNADLYLKHSTHVREAMFFNYCFVIFAPARC